jgi:Holliday junction resolvase RusA-like endonuclease
MIITIDKKTPSVNHLYFHWQGRTILTKEARELQKYIKETIGIPDISEFIDKKLSLTILIGENWYNKNGTIKKKDVENRSKFICDSVFSSIGLDDKQVFEHKMIKVQQEKEVAVVIIKELE